MKKIVILFTFLSFLLYGANPKPYAALGDLIFDNAIGIEKLQYIVQYGISKEKIETYIEKVKALKEMGYALEKGSAGVDKKVYLDALRILSKENDFFLREAKRCFDEAIEKQDSVTFERLIDTGLIDTQKNKEEIVEYYLAHQEDLKDSKNMQKFLDGDKKLRIAKEAERKKEQMKKEREAEKIRRIREADKRKKEALERELEQEVARKKEQIRAEQKSELFK